MCQTGCVCFELGVELGSGRKVHDGVSEDG